MDDNSSLSIEGRLLRSLVTSQLLGIAPCLVTLGRYQLQRRIGQGGMGLVFEALEPRSGERVALKVLRLRGNAALQRLKREFRVLSDLHHPNLVRFRELGQDSGDAFLTMDLVDGESVHAFVCPDGQFASARLRSVLCQLVGAVSYLHAHAVVHRDLKPSNLLVDRQGRLVVLDFGLAQAVGESSSDSRSGTQRFMAPERLRGEPASEASDWYSVGMVVRELLGEPQAQQNGTTSALPAELIAMCAALLSTDPAQRPLGSELRSGLGLPEPELAASPLRTLSERGLFVGRELELRQLERAFEHARAGRCCLALVHGAPGIGKSALVRRFLTRAAERARVFAGRCYEGELIPYNAIDGVIDALAEELSDCTPEQRARLCPDDMSELLRIFPALGPALGVFGEAPTPIQDIELRRLRALAFGSLGQLLAALAAERPLVIHLDDLHWGDADSARLLIELLSPPAPAGLLLIASYRSADAARSACVQSLRSSSFLDPASVRVELELGALSESAAFTLVHSLAGSALDREQLGQLSREAAGSPLFLRALVHAQLHSLPAPSRVVDLSTVLHNVVEQLTPPARELLEMVALCGRPVERELLLQAASESTDRGHDPDPLGALRQLGLVRHVPGRSESLECFHDRLRELVAGALTASRRREQHRKLASSAILATHPDSEFLAFHCAGAGRLPDASRYAELAGDRARAGAALENAARLYTLALDYARPARPAALLEKAADATAAAGGCGRAVALYLDAAERSHAPASWRLQLRAAEMLLQCGELERGYAVAAPLLRAAGVHIPRPRPLRLGVALAGLLRLKLGPDQRVGPHDGLRAEICFSLGHALWLNDRYLACALWVRTLPAALRSPAPGKRAQALAIYAFLDSLSGLSKPARSQALFDRARALAEACGDPDAKCWALVFQLVRDLNQAELADTLRQVEEALSSIDDRSVESGWLRSDLAVGYGWQLVHRGHIAALRVPTRSLVQRALDSGSVLHLRHARLHEGFLRLADDQPDAALALLQDWLPNRERKVIEGDVFAIWTFVHVLLYSGEYVRVWDEFVEQWPRLMRAGFTRDGVWVMALAQLRGNAALAHAARTGHATSFAAVEECVARLRRQRTRGALQTGMLMEAGLRQLRGERARAAELYASAASAFDALHQSGYAAAARMRQAALSDPSAAASIRRPALDWFREQGIANPTAWIRMYTPIEC